jgi:dihydroflavonol-4-reductase
MWLAQATAPAGLWWSRLRHSEPLFTPESLHALRKDPVVSTAKAARELGYETRPLRDTIADAYAWFRARGVLSRNAAEVRPPEASEPGAE